ncbi:uncharacterized protein LOC123549652 [Mercenaria mercenaria]|uniref:uncharacterized protein LOC123549652 n=1 Tax=Mercenaria mercenaria TaxID=6596 RepID=UPI00234E3B41|nr:uncharacterized protein LOC123549652 [Mercenaria mercenaria]XP_045193848.2 uncharacterized protein LOC123549652 [Mercenaria mercenaria]
MNKKDTRRNRYCLVLEDYGYTQNIRKRYKDHALFFEARKQIMQGTFSVLHNYKFGSFIEATMLPGQKSDMDMVTLLTSFIAFENRIHYDRSDSYVKCSLKMIVDPWTAPGHVKLVPFDNLDIIDAFLYLCTKYDIYGRRVLCYKRNIFYTGHLNSFRNYDTGPHRVERSGPAMTLIPQTGRHLDFIHALMCGDWPSCANAWLQRLKTLLWLGREEMQTLARLPCFLVPTGYHESNLEWRISFSLQERELFWKLTDLQYKCFIMMKYIKEASFGKEHFQSENSLTSYHCKTALFYTIENNSGIWKQGDLIDVTTLCFRLLLKWTDIRYCPSYFVPTLNLFWKLNDNDFENMKRLLQAFLAEPVVHFSKGIVLMHYMHNSELTLDPKLKELYDVYETPISSIKFIESLDHTHRELGDMLGNVMEYVSHLSLLETINHLASILNMKQRNDANLLTSLAFPFIHTTLACHFVILALESDHYSRDFYIMISAFHFWKGLKSDTMSSKLKLVTVLLYTGYKESAVALLKVISIVNTSCLFFGCSCFYSSQYDHGRSLHFYNVVCKRARNDLECLWTDELIHSHLCHCVMFLPTEIDITPYPLRFEMFRSYAVPDDARNPSKLDYWWFQCAVIDPETYMHFLWHLIDVSWIEKGQVFDELLETTTIHTWAHYHWETKVNVAGWLTERSGQNVKALEMYLSSWRLLKIRQLQYQVLPDNKLLFHTNNAAKWHLVLLLYRIWCERQFEIFGRYCL